LNKFLFLLFLLINSAFAQKYLVTGEVKDNKSGLPLSYASIRIYGTTNGTTTNNDGQFLIKLNVGTYQLIFSYVGYKTDTLLINVPVKQKIRINLQPEAIRLSEVVVNANENPAYRIIREAIKRKKENRKGLIDFEYNAYSKTMLKSGGELAAIEEIFVKGYNKINKWEKEFILSAHKTENQKKENRSMNFKISNSYYIDFSKDTLSLLMNKIYLPLADNAFDYYDYKLLSVTVSKDREIYKIKVIPRSKIQPLLKGEITIESGNYALTSADLQTNEGVRFLFVKDFSVKFVQQLGKYHGYWLPNYVETSASFSFSFQGLIALDKMQFNEVSSITGYKINIPIPDSVKNAVESNYGGYTADTTGKGRKPIQLTRKQINELRPIPLTVKEKKAYAYLDSTKTLEKIIKVKGALAGLIPKMDSQRDTTTGILTKSLELLTKYVTFGNNRVTGILIGPHFSGPIVGNKLFADLSGGYSFQRKKLEGDLKINYRPYKFFINKIEAQIFYKSKSWQSYSPYTNLMNGIAVTTGFNDQFNYYLSSGFAIGLTKYISKNFSADLNFTSEKESSLQEKKYESIFRINRIPRINPPIVAGSDRKTSLRISLGKDPMEIQFLPENGMTAQFDISNPFFGSNFNYKSFRFIGEISTKTFYKELFIAPYLEVIFDAGIITGNYGPQHLFSPGTALGFFSPVQAFKDLNPYEFAGSEMIALHVEHNWRSVPFQALGLKFISDLYLDFITGASVLKTWDKSKFLIGDSMSQPYWEIYTGISRILGVFRVDVSYNSFKKVSVTASVGVIL
jgi:hypothetical protein